MPDYTGNLNLAKPIPNEDSADIRVINENMDKIDEWSTEINKKTKGATSEAAGIVKYGTDVSTALEGSKLAEILGIEYGGVLNNNNQKVAGKGYYDTANKKIYKCTTNTSINYADAGYFIEVSNNDLLGKLQNLSSGVWFKKDMGVSDYAHIQYFGRGADMLRVSNKPGILGFSIDLLEPGLYDISITAVNSPTDSSATSSDRLLIVSDLIAVPGPNADELIDRYKNYNGGDDTDNFSTTVYYGDIRNNFFIERFQGSSSRSTTGAISVTIFRRA